MEIKKDFLNDRLLRIRLMRAEGYDGLENYLRQTGRSLGRMFGILSRAMDVPFLEVKIQDHIPMSSMHKVLFERLKTFVAELGLEGFSFNGRELTVVYDYRTGPEK